jgi:hypothetical protein
MPKRATTPIDDVERKRNEPASPEEMERRRQLLAKIDALRNRPVTEEEKEFWRKFDEELERERLTFRERLIFR